MEYLLTSRNLKILESFGLVKTLVAFDYDGTLTPIVSVPDQAIMKQTTENLFRELCFYRPVAIISGRSIKDMNKILKVKPKYLIGNHGAEWDSSDTNLSKMQDLFSQVKIDLQTKIDLHKDLGVTIEDKGYSLSLHFRNSPDPEKAESVLNHFTSELSNMFRIIPGKLVINIVSQDASNKHSALIQIMKEEQCSFALFFGDDVTDEDVFKNISSKIMTVRIGWSDNSQAKYFLKHQDEIDEVLALLTDGGLK